MGNTWEIMFATRVPKTKCKMIDGRDEEALSPTCGERMTCKVIMTRVLEATMQFFMISAHPLEI